MSTSRKIFMAFVIGVPFLIYCIVYYRPVIANAAFKRANFEGLELKYGGGALENRYNSQTGVYRYLDNADAVVFDTVRLDARDIDYIQAKANELGAWNFPDSMKAENGGGLAYDVTLKYKTRTKHFYYDTEYKRIEKLGNAAGQMAKVIYNTLQNAQARKNSGK